MAGSPADSPRRGGASILARRRPTTAGVAAVNRHRFRGPAGPRSSRPCSGGEDPPMWAANRRLTLGPSRHLMTARQDVAGAGRLGRRWQRRLAAAPRSLPPTWGVGPPALL